MKTLWFRDTYIVFVLSSKFRPRVIPMLYSFYLIVYLICISYFIYSYYIYLYLIIIISFFVCRLLYIGFLLSLIRGYNGDHCYFYFMFVVLGIYDNIKDISIWGFLFLCVVCDHWLYVIDLYIIIDLGFSFFIFYVLFWVMGI